MSYFNNNINKASRFILIGFFLTLVFREKLETEVTEWFVTPLLQFFEKSLISNSLFFIAVMGAFIFYLRKIKLGYQISLNTILVTLLAGIIYFVYRIKGEPWGFIKLYKSEWLSYTDLLFLPLLGNLILFSFSCLKKKKQIVLGERAYILDEPIKTANNDVQNRKGRAISFAERIVETNSEGGLAFGVEGEWGSGKTSFVYMMKESLRSKHKEIDFGQVVLLDFNPWLALDTEHMSQNFFDLLGEELAQYSASLASSFQQYSNGLTNASANVFVSMLNSIVNNFSPQSIKEQAEKIKSIIDTINKQIIVIIDDVDRLDSQEIRALFKLIRNVHAFGNIKFVMAFSKDYVLNALKEINNHNYQEYLDKIFLHIEHLEQIENISVKEIVLKELGSRFTEFTEEFEESLLGNSTFKQEHYLEDILCNYREIKLFLNKFIESFSKVKGEVFFDHFFKLELLKHKYVKVWQEIGNKCDVYFENYKIDGVYFPEETTSMVMKTTLEKSTWLNNYLEDNKEFLNIQKIDINLIKSILESVFLKPDEPFNSLNLLGANIRSYYTLYFTYSVPKDIVSNILFKKVIESSFDEIKSMFGQWITEGKKQNLTHHFTKINFEEISEKYDFEKIVKTLLLLYKSGNGGSLDYCFSEEYIIDKLNDWNGRISKKYFDNNKEKYGAFIKNIFNNEAAPPYLYEAGLLVYILTKEEDSIFKSDKEDLFMILINYFKSNLIGKRKIDSSIDKLSEYITKILKVIPELKRLDERKVLLKCFIDEQGLISLFPYVITTNIKAKEEGLNWFKLSEFLDEIFENKVSEIIVFVNSLSVEETVTKEVFLRFLEAWDKKITDKKFIDFDFGDIPVGN